MRDFTYSLGCGCKCTIFAESNYRTSRTTCCEEHSTREMYEFRNQLAYEARRQRERAMEWAKDRN